MKKGVAAVHLFEVGEPARDGALMLRASVDFAENISVGGTRVELEILSFDRDQFVFVSGLLLNCGHIRQ